MIRQSWLQILLCAITLLALAAMIVLARYIHTMRGVTAPATPMPAVMSGKWRA